MHANSRSDLRRVDLCTLPGAARPARLRFPHRLSPRAVASIVLACAVLSGGPGSAETPTEPYPPLGFRPLPVSLAERLEQPVMAPPEAELPATLDWRDSGIVTPAKTQQSCGACWAFAAIACIESMCILAGGSPSLNFSEQFPISCDVEFRPMYGVRNEGCCGGSVTVFEFLSENFLMEEATFPFGNGDYDGTGPRTCDVTPSWNTVPCPSPYPEQTGWRVENWMLIAPQPIPGVSELKAALQEGPVWLGFRVYEDFIDYWYYEHDTTTPYRHVDGAYLGGHAVLLIGYDDERQCWIVKNSWGLTGPFRDGTFLVDYDDACDFGLNAARVTIEADETPTRQATLGSIRALYR